MLNEIRNVSVIIPTYKPGTYIWECLDSLAAQTLPKERFEVIVVLNGPREPFYSQLSDYAARNGNRLSLKLLYCEKPGVSNARNMGIDAAEGEFMAFVDDDDTVSDNYLQRLLDKTPDDGIVVSNVVAVNDVTKTAENYFLTEAYRSNAGRDCPSLFQTRSFLSSVWGKLIPASIIAADRFDTRFSLSEDALYMFSVSRRIKRVALADEDVTYFVRMRPQSAMHRHYSYMYRLRLALTTAWRFTAMYLKHPLQYSAALYFSRVYATLRKLFYKTHR